MFEFETVELVLELADFLAVACHDVATATRLFHDLVNYELRVASNLKSPDGELDGNLKTIQEYLILSNII